MGTHPATASPLVHRHTLEEFFALEPPLVVPFAAYSAAHPERCVLLVPRAAVWTLADTYLEPDLFLVAPEEVRERPDGFPRADLEQRVLEGGRWRIAGTHAGGARFESAEVFA